MPVTNERLPMTAGAKRSWIVTAICVASTAVVLLLYCYEFPPLLNLELESQDIRARVGRKAAVDPSLVFIGIDKPTYADVLSEEEIRQEPALGMLARNFPWSRAVWASLIERLCQAGAKVVAIDLVFAASADGDDALKIVLEKYRSRVVIGANFSDVNIDGSRGTLALTLPDSTLLNNGTPAMDRQDDRVGYINIWADWDGIIRRARYRLSSQQAVLLAEGELMESMAARVLRKSGRLQSVPAGFEQQLFRYSGPPGRGYAPLPLYSIFLPSLWKTNFHEGDFFRDKIVLVGPAANVFHDDHHTPFRSYDEGKLREMLGPELHLNMIGAALQKEFLRDAPPALNWGVISLSGLLAWALGVWLRQDLRRLVLALALSIGYWVLCQVLFDHGNVVVLAVSPLLALNVSSLLVFVYDFVLERLEKRRVRGTLERYVSKDVARELLDNPQTFFNALGGVRKSITILFSDVRSFTTLTEGSDSALLVKQLNEYFSEMVALVVSNHGSLDKFIGDAVMAVWGNIVTQGPELDARHSVVTALAMKRGLVRLNAGWKTRGLPELSFGIGINSGEAIVGNLGSTQKMELTVIGDPVNLASRLEGLTKQYKIDLLLGASTAALVRDQYFLRTVDLVQPKGKTKPADSGRRHLVPIVSGTQSRVARSPAQNGLERGLRHDGEVAKNGSARRKSKEIGALGNRDYCS